MALDINVYDSSKQYSDVISGSEPKEKLPNSTAVLVLGIISIAICTVGFITGAIALALASGDLKQLRANSEKYSESSVKNLNAGRICAIIGLSLSVFVLLVYALYFYFVLSIVDSFGNMMEKAIEHQHNMPIE